ncbi:MAG: TRAP transporter large permease subunit [Chloroflexaceae bacterium]|nr:TRAP transporter large permease subunit [Chloroflexaceae bacterium]
MTLHEWLSLLMFAALLGFLATGYPVAFSLGGVALLFAGVGVVTGAFDVVFLQAMPSRIFGIMANFTLLAVPYFVFMGAILERTGIAEDLLETMGILFGPLRGGLAIAVVVVGALLAATTGVIAATVVAMSMISLPIMLRYGYSKLLTTGVICASGTLGQIIPPSVVLVVLGDQMGVSVGDLFIGSLLPGLLITGLFVAYCLVIAWLKPEMAPALPPSERTLSGQALQRRVLKVMVPPLVLIIAVLGSIFFGWASATEAGAVGALGACVLGLFNRKLSLGALREASDATLRLTTMVIFILIGSTAFTLVFRGLRGHVMVGHILTSMPGGYAGFLAFSMLLIFALGFFIDFFEICFIVVPLLVPAAEALGINLVWFGVVIGVNLQMSFLTPPFGFALFYLRGAAPPESGIATQHIYLGVLPFIALQAVALLLIILFPGMVTFLLSFGQ